LEPVDLALLMLRVTVGLTMVAHGVNHWIGGGKISGTARWFEGLGLRHGIAQAWASVITEIGAGALLVLGLVTPLAAAAVVSVALIAALLAHRPNGFFVFKDGWEYVAVLAVVSTALGLSGPGSMSLDHVAGTVINGWAGGLVTLGVGLTGTAILLMFTYRPQRPEATAIERL
jgi:putative oxidoreductase